MKISIFQKLIIFSILILEISGFIGYAVYKNKQKLKESEQLMQRAAQIVSESGNILLLGKDIETASRGFVITNDSAFLEPLFIAEKIIFERIAELKQLTIDNPAQQQRIKFLNFYMHKRLDWSNKTDELRGTEGLASAIAYVSTDTGNYYSEQIRQIITAIQQDEATLLRQRKQMNESSVATFNRISIVLFLLITVFIVFLLYIIGKYLHQIEEKEKRAAELIIANKELIFQNKEKEKRAAELIIAREKAVESDRLKSAFLANMSHEIRTPMNGILGFTELLKDTEITVAQKEYYISIIERSGVRLLNIINDILSISKIESGQMEVFISATNINEQIEYIYNFFKPEVEQKGLQFYFKNSLPERSSIIKTDQDKIYVILTNLIKNAIKFTKTGYIEFGYHLKPVNLNAVVLSGELRSIDQLVEPVELEFFVKDSGVGIRPEQLEIVFERFRQVSESLNRSYEGAGLGLSISKAFAEMLGGKMRIESELGKGTAIYFTIPYHTEQEEKTYNKNIDLVDFTDHQD